MTRAIAAVLGVTVAAGCGRGAGPAVETAVVARGDYADVLEVRGDVKPVRTRIISAPRDAGELVILKLARNGSAVKAGDVVAEFDAVNMRRTILEKQSELRSARAEGEQAEAQGKIAMEERQAAVRRAAFDVERAKLQLGDIALVSVIEGERAKLALADAEQRLLEAEAGLASLVATQASDRTSRARRAQKIQGDLDRAQASVKALSAIAPTDGTVNVLPNFRSSSPMAMPPEFRPGDRTYAGAQVLELPDLSQVYLVARLDESDRGPLRIGQKAAVRTEAVADREYTATVKDVSLLARIDFMGGWPPAKLFDVTLTIDDPDGRLRPGMSAVARIGVGRLEGVLLAPARAVFTIDGQAVVFREARGEFERVPVTVVRRGREQVALDGAIRDGDRIALVRPDQPAGGAK